MTEQPPPLNYHTPRPTGPLPPIRLPFLKFAGGVFAGLVAIVLSGLVAAGAQSGVPVFLGGGAEFVAGILVTINSRDARPFGIGLICAIPVGVMLFFVGCAIMISMK